MFDPNLIAELLSKFSAAAQAPQDAAPSNTQRRVDLDIRVQGSVTTTETDVIPPLAPDK
jgi:hypothetical protein